MTVTVVKEITKKIMIVAIEVASVEIIRIITKKMENEK